MRTLFVALLAVGTLSSAHAEDRTLCVYDPLGTNGPAYKTAEAMRLDAQEKYGITFKLRADVEERTAAADLVAGKCDGAVVTGVAARTFGLASATLEAIGALPEYSWLEAALAYLADERMAPKMVSGDYETAGVYPAGAIYLYTRDKSWTRASDLAGKSISVIDDDEAALTMIREVGASGKSASTATFGPMYNSGSVDACYAPATAFEPLELYKGLEKGGGIIDFPLSQLTLQVVIRKDRFPDGFGQWGRTYSYQQRAKSKKLIQAAEDKVEKYLVDIPDADKPGYADRFLKVRLSLKSKGVYDSTVLGLMRRVRCQKDPARAECADPKE